MLTGLVVGKFCPLHRGHEGLIAFARARCDRLVLLSYTNPDLGYPTTLRAQWLADVAPNALRLVLDDAVLADFAARSGTPPRRLPPNDAPDEVHREFSAWACHAMLGVTIDRVFTSEDYGPGFAATLTRYFREHAGASGVVEHVYHDPARALVPVSGTAIRADPQGQRHFLSGSVRASLVARVGILGGESSGKTTLAQALARDMATAWVPEYGRELWERRDGRLDYDDMLAIATEQIAREDSARHDASGRLFCDTTPLTTALYSEAMFGRTAPALQQLARRRYDHILLCAPDFTFVQDGTRRDAAFRQQQHDWYRRELDSRQVDHAIVSGPLPDRLAQAKALLADVRHWIRSERDEADLART